MEPGPVQTSLGYLGRFGPWNMLILHGPAPDNPRRWISLDRPGENPSRFPESRDVQRPQEESRRGLG